MVYLPTKILLLLRLLTFVIAITYIGSFLLIFLVLVYWFLNMTYIAASDNSVHPASTQVRSVVRVAQPAHFPYQHQHQHHQHHHPSSTQVQPVVAQPPHYPYQHQHHQYHHPGSTQVQSVVAQPVHVPYQYQQQHQHHQHAYNPPPSSFNCNLPLYEVGDQIANRIAKMRKNDQSDDAQHANNPPPSSFNCNLPLYEEGDQIANRIAKMRKNDQSDDAIRGVVEKNKTAEHTVQPGPGPVASCHLLQNANVVRSLFNSTSANLQRLPEAPEGFIKYTNPMSNSNIVQGRDRAQDQSCMYTAVKNEVPTTVFPLSRPTIAPRFSFAPVLERPTHHTSDPNIDLNRQKQPLHCFDFGQQNRVEQSYCFSDN